MHCHQPHQKTGAVTVEVAFVATLFFVLVFAGIEFGRLTMMRHTAELAAYEAARTIVVPGASADDAIARANTVIAQAGMTNAEIVISPNPISESTSSVTASVRVPVAGNSWTAPRWLMGGASIAGESTMMTERVAAIQVNAVPDEPPPPPPPPAPPMPPVPPGDDDDDGDGGDDGGGSEPAEPAPTPSSPPPSPPPPPPGPSIDF